MPLHIDLVRNDYNTNRQVPIARVHLVEGGYGLIVENLGAADCVPNIFAALGPKATEHSKIIIEALEEVFGGPYVMASAPHGDDCPFADGPVDIETEAVVGDFRLPDPETLR